MKTTTIRLSGILLLLFTLLFTACKKDNLTSDDLMTVIVNEEATVELSKANFTTKENGLVKATGGNYYEAGSMEYIVEGTTEAIIEFKEGGNCNLNKNGSSFSKSLKGKSKKNKKFTKVILSPIVKVTGCQWIVQGIIEYYDDNNNLLATIDFGNGTCDEWATKTFPNNSKPAVTFSQDDWFKK